MIAGILYVVGVIGAGAGGWLLAARLWALIPFPPLLLGQVQFPELGLVLSLLLIGIGRVIDLLGELNLRALDAAVMRAEAAVLRNQAEVRRTQAELDRVRQEAKQPSA